MPITETFKSKSSNGIYTCTLHDDGHLVCNCRGYLMRNVNGIRECTHTQKMQAKHGTGSAPAPAPIVTAPVVERVKPMLASALPEGKTIADYNTNWIMEEKYDGHRLLVEIAPSGITAWSRAGNTRQLSVALTQALHALAPGLYDGELVVIGGGTSSDVVRLDRLDGLRYVIFDLLRVGDVSCTRMPLAERRILLDKAASLADGGLVSIAPQWWPSQTALDEIWAAGGEGVVIKHLFSRYVEDSRSSEWIKFKKRGSARVTITGFEKGKSGPHSTVVGLDAYGIEVKVKALNHEWLALFAQRANDYIGTTMVISYNDKTKSGKYRHAMADHLLEA